MFFWAKMWGSGEAYNQRDRIIDSKVVSSEQLADMYLMYKDHKEGRATRPVVHSRHQRLPKTQQHLRSEIAVWASKPSHILFLQN